MEKEFRVYFGGANKAAPSSSVRPKRISVVNATAAKTNPIKKFYDFAVGNVVLPSSSTSVTTGEHLADVSTVSIDSATKEGRRRSMWEKPAEFILGVEVSRCGSASSGDHVGLREDENCDNYNTDNADNITYAEDFEYFDEEEDNNNNDNRNYDEDEHQVAMSTKNCLSASIKSVLSTPVKPSVVEDPSIDDSPSWFKALKEENTDHLNGRMMCKSSSASSSGSKPPRPERNRLLPVKSNQG